MRPGRAAAASRSASCFIYFTLFFARRNVEELVGGAVRVCDRTALILDIFSQRALTREAGLQVAMAQAEYQLPR